MRSPEEIFSQFNLWIVKLCLKSYTFGSFCLYFTYNLGILLTYVDPIGTDPDSQHCSYHKYLVPTLMKLLFKDKKSHFSTFLGSSSNKRASYAPPSNLQGPQSSDFLFGAPRYRTVDSEDKN